MMQNPSQPGQSFKFDKTPTDTISCIASNGNPNNQLVCCTSWDNSITVWQIPPSQNNCPSPKYLTTIKSNTHDAMLCCTFKENDMIIGTATGKILQLKYGESDTSTVGSHAGIVSGVRWCPGQNLLMSGSSYDFKINFWDLRDTTKPTKSIDLQGKCKCLDVANDKAIIVTSDNKINQYDLKSSDKKLKTFPSKITSPITSVAISNDGNGYVVGGLYGVLEANLSGTGGDLIPCHRDINGASKNIYASNCVAISNISPKNVIISGGGNGTVEYINAETLTVTLNGRKFTQNGDPVTACSILPKQKIYVVATGNDWSHGSDGSNGAPKPEMQIRMFNAKEIGG